MTTTSRAFKTTSQGRERCYRRRHHPTNMVKVFTWKLTGEKKKGKNDAFRKVASPPRRSVAATGGGKVGGGGWWRRVAPCVAWESDRAGGGALPFSLRWCVPWLCSAFFSDLLGAMAIGKVPVNRFILFFRCTW